MTVSARGVCSVLELDGSHGSVLDGSHGSVSPWCVQCPGIGWFSWQCPGWFSWQCPGWMVLMAVSVRGVCSVLDGWLP